MLIFAPGIRLRKVRRLVLIQFVSVGGMRTGLSSDVRSVLFPRPLMALN
jgi:hypothetical protein